VYNLKSCCTATLAVIHHDERTPIAMPDLPENSESPVTVNPRTPDFDRGASLKKNPTIHGKTRQALADLLETLGMSGRNGGMLASLFQSQWTEGVSTESAQRIEKWLDELVGSMLAGTVRPTLRLKKILSDWQRDLNAKLLEHDRHWHSRFPHLESRALCRKVSEAGTIARFLSAYPITSHEDSRRMRNLIACLALPLDETYRLVARMARRKDVCDENRDRIIDALMLPHAAADRPAAARAPANIDAVFKSGEDLGAFLAYAQQHRDSPAWFPVTQVLMKRRVHGIGGDLNHVVSAAMLDAKAEPAARQDFDRTVAPLKAVYRKIGNSDIAHILQTVLDGCRGREDEWLFQLFIYVSEPGPQTGFKARLRQALKQLTGHDRADETLRMTLFRFALHADLLRAADMLCREAGPEIDFDACLDEAIEQTRIAAVEPEAVRLIVAAMSPKQRQRALSMIRDHLEPLLDIREKENLLGKKDGELLLDRTFTRMIHPPFLPSKAQARYAAVLRKEISQEIERARSRHANLEQMARVAEELAGMDHWTPGSRNVRKEKYSGSG
jgi:hypothetical protein